ncbi:hypothetical protein [Tenacibaculum dicentrarchi]|uniref:hypothetical protein n=1 Tax=Tenacibaculum dicentrarchi TaxID=669041 RepID=UPI000C7E0196
MKFIKVTAKPCTSEGETRGGIILELKINADIIGAFDGKEIMLKNGNIINLGGKWFTDFRLAQEID